MSCGTPVTRHLIAYHAHEYGVEFTEASRLFHWLKSENQRTLRYSSEDPGAAIGVTGGRQWLQASQQLLSAETGRERLSGMYSERLERISDGSMPVKLAELDALRSLPGVLAVRTQAGRCLQCGQYVGMTGGFHDCPVHDPVARKIRWPLGNDVSHMTAWWNDMPAEVQDSMIYRYPERIGKTDGLPILARDRANRIVLEREEMRLQQVLMETAQPSSSYVLNSLSPSALLHARWVAEEQMRIVQGVKRAIAGGLDMYLPVFETFPLPGRAAVSVGNADTAKNVTVLVPGMNNFVGNKMGDVAADAVALKDTADFYSILTSSDWGESSATIGWIGYHAPSVAQVWSKKNAKEGAPSLRNFLLGMRSLRADQSELHLSVIGHSYGSVVSSLAVHKDDNDKENLVDNIAFIGSPGVNVRRVERFQPYEGKVFTAAAEGDAVAHFAWFGSAPTSDKFGAYVIQTKEGVDPLTGKELIGSYGHSQYYEMDSFSLRNLALLSLGKNSLVTMRDDYGKEKRPS